jgi:hypothetical protein
VTTDGVHRPVDAIICSTGANINYAPPFPIVSGDLDLSRDWRPDGKFGWPRSYLGIGTDGKLHNVCMNTGVDLTSDLQAFLTSRIFLVRTPRVAVIPWADIALLYRSESSW